jgi:hypothetical protein
LSQQLIDIEYMPNGSKLEYVRKRGLIYIAVGPRPSDGFTVLKIRSPGASKNHNIEVGAVYAVTVGGRRHVLETPNGRWKLRAQELRHLLGEPIEDWTVEYFNSASPKYFKRAQAMYRKSTHRLRLHFAILPAPAPCLTFVIAECASALCH